jgi:hypothetical protein
MAIASSLALVGSDQALSDTDDATACEERLARTLAEMESRPLLKEELATGLMWLRLDAQTALANGDATTCLEGVRIVEEILGVEGLAR